MNPDNGREIKLEDGTLTGPSEVKESVELDDGDVIVLFNTTGKYDQFDDETRSRNIWRVASDGAFVWKIEQAEMIGGDYGSFSGLWTESGEIWAYNTNGLAYKIDPETGRLGETRQMK